MIWRALLILISLILFNAHYCAAAEQLPLSDSISIKADSLQQEQGDSRYIAKGSVVITYSGMELHADRATYDSSSSMLTAEGNVTMAKGDDLLTGTKFTVDIATGRTELEQGSLEVRKGNIHLTGTKIIREDEQHLQLTQTELTTCDLPNPDWKFGAENLKVDLLGYATGRNIIFYVKDVPVLYLPWIAFPVVRDRKSGLLFPRFGYSSRRGAQVTLPVYLVLAPNQDLQVDLDLQSKRGVGTGALYRYARKRGSEGSAGGYIIYDLDKNRWRGQVAQQHKEIFSDSMNLRSNINLTGDRQFLHDFGEKSGDYNRQLNESTINALKTWQHFALTGLARYSDNLAAASNRTTVQKLPEIGLASVRQPIGTSPLFFDLDSSIGYLYRESGTTGERLTAFPRLTLPAKIAGGANGSLYAGVQLRGYLTERDRSTPSGDQSGGRILPEAGGKMSLPLFRVYEAKIGSLEKLRHEIIPELGYHYTGATQMNRLPFYDYDDRPVAQSQLSWALTNRLGGRFRHGDTTSYRSLLNLTLSQGYTFAGKRQNLLTMVDQNRKLDDLTLESDSWLQQDLRLTFDSRYNFHDNRITSATPGIEYDTRRGTTLGAAYRLSRNEVEYAELRLSTKFASPWMFSYTSRFSFDRSAFLESVYTAEYVQKCWSVTMQFRDRPGNKTGTINFNLAGLTGN